MNTDNGGKRPATLTKKTKYKKKLRMDGSVRGEMAEKMERERRQPERNQELFTMKEGQERFTDEMYDHLGQLISVRLGNCRHTGQIEKQLNGYKARTVRKYRITMTCPRAQPELSVGKCVIVKGSGTTFLECKITAVNNSAMTEFTVGYEVASPWVWSILPQGMPLSELERAYEDLGARIEQERGRAEHASPSSSPAYATASPNYSPLVSSPEPEGSRASPIVPLNLERRIDSVSE